MGGEAGCCLAKIELLTSNTVQLYNIVFILFSDFQEALVQLRGVSSGVGRIGDPIETLQSRARELEKKVGVISI